MVNGKNVSMFASYPRSAAWELAHTFATLLFQPPFFEPVGTNREAARVQAKAMVTVLRLVGEIEEARDSPRQDRARRKPPFDWMEEADRVEDFAREVKWDALIHWAQETRGKFDRHLESAP